MGEEGFEASTRVTVLACNRATDDQRIVTTRIRAPMTRQDVQTQAQKYLSTISHQQSPQPVDISAVMTGSKCQSCGSQTRRRHDCWYKDETCKIRGKTRTFGKMMPKRKCTHTEKRKLQERSEYLKHVCVVERQDTKRQIVNSRVRHVPLAAKLVT